MRWLLFTCLLMAFSLLPWGLSPSAHAQGMPFEQAEALFGQQRILHFRTFSLDMKDESRTQLAELSQLIRQYPQMFRSNLLMVQVFTCEKELAIKPYLGACRGQVVIDYLEQQVGLPRKKCLIQETGSSAYAQDCEAGSGVNLYLKPDW